MLPRSLGVSDSTIASMVEAAEECGMPLHRLVLEVTEGEIIDDLPLFALRINEFRRLGIRLAIDDFGAGYCGLNLLADFQSDTVKLDMNLVRGIDSRGPRQAIVRAIHQVCEDLGIDVIAEGVETAAEFAWFRRERFHLFQGYLFARPEFERLPQVSFADLMRHAERA